MGKVKIQTLNTRLYGQKVNLKGAGKVKVSSDGIVSIDEKHVEGIVDKSPNWFMEGDVDGMKAAAKAKVLPAKEPDTNTGKPDAEELKGLAKAIQKKKTDLADIVTEIDAKQTQIKDLDAQIVERTEKIAKLAEDEEEVIEEEGTKTEDDAKGDEKGENKGEGTTNEDKGEGEGEVDPEITKAKIREELLKKSVDDLQAIAASQSLPQEEWNGKKAQAMVTYLMEKVDDWGEIG